MNAIKKTLAGSDASGQLFLLDTIEHEEQLWLVPMWTVFHDEKLKKPNRIIRLDGLPYQKVKFGQADFLLRIPIPKELLDRRKPDKIAKPFVVKEAPDISVPILNE